MTDQLLQDIITNLENVQILLAILAGMFVARFWLDRL
jgi:hypothetical protein